MFMNTVKDIINNKRLMRWIVPLVIAAQVICVALDFVVYPVNQAWQEAMCALFAPGVMVGFLVLNCKICDKINSQKTES